MIGNPFESYTVVSQGDGTLTRMVDGIIGTSIQVTNLEEARANLHIVAGFYNLAVDDTLAALLLGHTSPENATECAIVAACQDEAPENIRAMWEKGNDYVIALLAKVLLWMANHANTYPISIKTPEIRPSSD